MNPLRYFEVDFEAVTREKFSCIKRAQEVFQQYLATTTPATEGTASQTEIHTNDYHLIAADLRELEVVKQKLSDCGFDYNCPTLFLSECVLVYMDSDMADQIVGWAATVKQSAAFLTYEQIIPDDAFGKIMIKNLKVFRSFCQKIFVSLKQ